MDLQIFYRNNCTIINQIIHLKYLKKKKKAPNISIITSVKIWLIIVIIYKCNVF